MIEPQPTPVDSGEPDIQPLVAADLDARYAHGVKMYGQGLKIDNGRDMLRDLYEEQQDALIYTRGEMLKRERMLKIITHLESLHVVEWRGEEDYCTTCHTSAPCHTLVDLGTLRDLLGVVGE